MQRVYARLMPSKSCSCKSLFCLAKSGRVLQAPEFDVNESDMKLDFDSDKLAALPFPLVGTNADDVDATKT